MDYTHILQWNFYNPFEDFPWFLWGEFDEVTVTQEIIIRY